MGVRGSCMWLCCRYIPLSQSADTWQGTDKLSMGKIVCCVSGEQGKSSIATSVAKQLH